MTCHFTKYIALLIRLLCFGANLFSQEHINTLTVISPTSIAGDYEVAAGTFGNNIVTEPSFSGTLELFEDAEDPITDGCSEAVNDMTGMITLIDRGACAFVDKVVNAVTAGAIAVVICNNIPEDNIFEPGGEPPFDIMVPVVMASYEDCQAIRIEISNEVFVEFSYSPPRPCQVNCYEHKYPATTVWGANGEGDFACGLGDWVTIGISNPETVWIWDADGMANNGWSNTLFMTSSWACNGSAIMDYASYNTTGETEEYHTAELISPSIDLTGVDHPILNFTSANLPLNSPFTSTLGPKSSAFWSYSIDGGQTWQDTVLIESNFDFEDPLSNDAIEMNFVMHNAANQSNVKLKFIASGDFYHLIIDGVYVTDEVHPVVVPDYEWFAGAPNFKTPTSQVDKIAFMVDIKNTGNVPFDESMYSVEVKKGFTVIHSTMSDNLGSLPIQSKIENMVLPDAWQMSSEVGTYTISYTASATGNYESIDTESNLVQGKFMVTDSKFSKMLSEQEAGCNFMIGEGGTGSYITYANGYYIPNADTDTGPKSLNTGFASDIYNILGPTTLTGEVREWVMDINSDGIANLNTETRLIAQGQVRLDPQFSIDLRNINISLEPYESQTGRFDVAGQYLAVVHVAPLMPPTDSVSINPLSSGVITNIFGNRDYLFAGADFAFKELGYILGRPSSLSDFNGTADDQDFRHLDPTDSNSYSWNIAMEIGYVPVETVSAVHELEQEHIQLQIFPNPASDYITIDMDLAEESQTVDVQILNLSGIVVLEQSYNKLTNQALRLDTKDFSAGVYLVNIITDEGVGSETVFIQK